MELGKTLYVKDRARWRAWLEKNHSKEKEIWLIFYRKQAGKPSLPYEDAVEEALCFGMDRQHRKEGRRRAESSTV